MRWRVCHGREPLGYSAAEMGDALDVLGARLTGDATTHIRSVESDIWLPGRIPCPLDLQFWVEAYIR